MASSLKLPLLDLDTVASWLWLEFDEIDAAIDPRLMLLPPPACILAVEAFGLDKLTTLLFSAFCLI
jgi:hypothetical protein